MVMRNYRRLSYLLIGCSFVLLFSAFSSPVLAKTVMRSQNNAPSVTTACPAPGKGRAAVLPPLTLGKDQNIVYDSVKTNPASSVLKRYDVTTKSTTKILTLNGGNITWTQISANGQWVLFVNQVTVNGSYLFKLQLVRMDGKYLQTLYCSTAGNGIDEVQWSTDLKLIAFVFVTSSSIEDVDVLNTTNGSVQTVYSTPTSNFVIVRTWLDTHRLYLTNTQTDQPPNIIYLLDVNHPGTLQTVFNGSFSDFDSSYNGQSLYTSNCVCGLGGNQGPGTIMVQPATGGQQQTVYTSSTDAILSVRAALPTTLLFIVDNVTMGGGTFPDNGLWQINSNGTGVTQLMATQSGQNVGLNQFTQFPWSNVSRDGSLYSLQVVSTQSGFIQTLETGPLGGSPSTAFATVNGKQVILSVVGWTTM